MIAPETAKELLHYAATHTFSGDTDGFGRWLPGGLGVMCVVHDGAWYVVLQRPDRSPDAEEIAAARTAFQIPGDAAVTWPHPHRVRLGWPCLADLALGPDGAIAQSLPGYEYREPQLYMARLVEIAARNGEKLVVEGPTGTGKSLAYLAPLILMGKRIVVSTANKALQGQLFYKDIPFLQQHLTPFTAALAKGKQNYLCLHKAEGGLSGVLLPRPEMHDWYEETETGDLEELDFVLEPDEAEVITAGDNDCLRKRCHFYNSCWYYKAKQRRQEAQVVVTNHMLLCLHQKHPEAQILPSADVLVVDEAHQLESYAVNVSSEELTPFSFSRLPDLLGPDGEVLRNRGRSFLDALAERIGDGENQAGIRRDLEYGDGLELATDLTEVARSIWNGADRPETAEEQKLENEAKSVHRLAGRVLLLAQPTPEGAVRHVERAKTKKGQEYVKASFTTFDVSEFLAELAESFPSAIYASATIAVPDFDFFIQRNGLAEMEPLTFRAESPFDYARNARLYLPNGQMPDPRQRDDFNQAVIEEIAALVAATDGGAFLLFTSYYAMNAAFEALAWRKDWRWPTLRQGEQSKTAILRRFAEAGNAVLFATKSFWEGVDVKGDALRLVVIDKVPFAQPSPVQQARADHVEGQGGSWFADLALPEAIIDLKQGFGRLIRTRTDTGIIALLDPRVTRKPYGKRILAALPPAGRASKIEDVAAFYRGAAQLAMELVRAEAA